MTNAQKWVLIIFVIFIGLLAVGRLTKNSGEDVTENSYMGNGQQQEELDGMALIQKAGCTSCHGSDLKGTSLAPSLFAAKEYWSRDKLINYLRNPSSYSGDSRFEKYKEIYRTIMPAFNNIDVKQLGIIADYLLQLEKE